MFFLENCLRFLDFVDPNVKGNRCHIEPKTNFESNSCQRHKLALNLCSPLQKLRKVKPRKDYGQTMKEIPQKSYQKQHKAFIPRKGAIFRLENATGQKAVCELGSIDESQRVFSQKIGIGFTIVQKKRLSRKIYLRKRNRRISGTVIQSYANLTLMAQELNIKSNNQIIKNSKGRSIDSGAYPKPVAQFTAYEKYILQLKPTNETDAVQKEIESCPVLRPTWKQFRNFYQFAEKADRLYKSEYGMVKVVPPPEWKPRRNEYSKSLDHLSVNGPIEQNISGKGGVYECLHIQKKSLTLKQYQTKTGVFDKITDKLTPQQTEKMFWKNIIFSPPLYGADLLNTLMDDRAGLWNMNCLQSILLDSMQTRVKGVNTPYCYIGSWKTLFCWHKEDLDLSAINYIHEGKSKFWYSLPASQAYILEKEAKRLFPEHASKCAEFLRHKTTLISPYLLRQKYPELKINKVEHKQGQFILVFGGAYHCGFNFGFNIAEAVNYGTLSWLKQLLDSKPCSCSKNSVKASHIEIYKNLEKTCHRNTKQFQFFKEQVFKELEQESGQDIQDVKAIKSQFSQKIKKLRKVPKKMKYKGDDYEIDHWAQCESCHLWRKVSLVVGEKQRFSCRNVGKKCNNGRERMSKSYITL